jgi:hypothetical protein
MQVNENVLSVLRLPSEYYRLGSSSFRDLLLGTGYFVNYNHIDESDLIEGLRQSPGYVQDWMQYSEDKRSSSGWYILNENGIYVVGFLCETGVRKDEKKYTDSVIACATFLKKEIEHLRNSETSV